MYMKLKGGKSKVLNMSYDDGYVHDIRFLEILDKYGIKASLNINTGMYLPEDAVRDRPRGKLKLSECQDLYIKSPHNVAVHGWNHPFMELLKPQEVLEEVLVDRKNIEQQYGTLARGMVMPYGTYTEEVIDAIKMCGIDYLQLSGQTEKFDFPKDWHHWIPTCRHYNPKWLEFAHKFVEEEPDRRYGINWLFCVAGHSWEFNRHKNWDQLEEFCALVGGKEDIWYATCIELRDYVMAYESLQVSVDKTIIRNPSAMDVWFEEKKVIYCVKAGESIRL